MKSVHVSKPGTPRKSPKQVNLQVVARIRPMTATEIRGGAPRCLDINTNLQEVAIKTTRNSRPETKAYNFAKVYGPSSTQETIFEDTVSPCLDDVCKGYSCTLFAYGQTGTGKTYTMEGVKNDDGLSPNICSSGAGIIPRSMHHLFERLESTHMNFTIRVSMLELYNEKLIDLLDNKNLKEEDIKEGLEQTLKIYENPETGTPYVGNLTEIDVVNRTQVFDILAMGSAKRTTAATQMNAHSSRSHCIFQAVVNIQQPDSESMTTGRLYLVDLAGSENIGRSGAKNIRAKEAGNINKSLLTLGRVINLLVEKATTNSKINHIPYRDSQLTRLLQNALGGKSKTTMIITLSPSKLDYDESMSSLEYGHRAQNIRNRPEVTETKNVARHVDHLTEEIKKLQSQLILQSNKAGGIMIPIERKMELDQKEEAFEQLAEANIELEAKHAEMVGLLDEHKSMNLDLKMDLGKLNKKLAATEYVAQKSLETSQNQKNQSENFKTSGISLEGILSTANQHIGAFNQVCTVNDLASGDFVKKLETKSSELDILVKSVTEIISECENCMQMYSEEQFRNFDALERLNSEFSGVFESKMTDLSKNVEKMDGETSDFSCVLRDLVEKFSVEQNSKISKKNTDMAGFTEKSKKREAEILTGSEKHNSKISTLIQSSKIELEHHRKSENKFHEEIKSEIDENVTKITDQNNNYTTELKTDLTAQQTDLTNFYTSQSQNIDSYNTRYTQSRTNYNTKHVELDEKYKSWIEKNRLKTEARHTQFLTNLQTMMINFSSSEKKASEDVSFTNLEHLRASEDEKTVFLEGEEQNRERFFGEVVESGQNRVKIRSEEIKLQLERNERLVEDISGLTGKLSGGCDEKMEVKLGEFLKYETAENKKSDEILVGNSDFSKKLLEDVTGLSKIRENRSEIGKEFSDNLENDINILKTAHSSQLDEFLLKMNQSSSNFTNTTSSITSQQQTFTANQNSSIKSISDRFSKHHTAQNSNFSKSKQETNNQTLMITGLNVDSSEFMEKRQINPGFLELGFDPNFDANVVINADRIKFELDFSEILKNEDEEKQILEKKMEEERILEEQRIEDEKKCGVVDENEYLVGLEDASGGFFENHRKTSQDTMKSCEGIDLPLSTCPSSVVDTLESVVSESEIKPEMPELKCALKPELKPEFKPDSRGDSKNLDRGDFKNSEKSQKSEKNPQNISKTRATTNKPTISRPTTGASSRPSSRIRQKTTISSTVIDGENSPRKVGLSSPKKTVSSPRKTAAADSPKKISPRKVK